MRLISLCLFLMAFTAHAGNPSPKTDNRKASVNGVTEFGKMKKGQKPISLANALANYEDHKDKMISFDATPKKVCEKKGCWMVLRDGGREVRTLFKDYGFFVPKEIVGKRVRVQGIMEQKHISAATIRHYMKDEGKKLEEIKKVKTGKTSYQFVASGVQIIEP